MNDEFVKRLVSMQYENEYIEFKLDWMEREELGKYISAISNAAAVHKVDFGYMLWGIDNETHEILGTSFNPDIDIKDEPLKHYLARNLKPSISFEFQEVIVDDKRVVVLIIPAAKDVITEFNYERYIRIGSSKELLKKYPQREKHLWMILEGKEANIVNTKSPKQDLSFLTLKAYFIDKGIDLPENDIFYTNQNLYVPNTEDYNVMAFLLSDNNDITCRVSIFSGKSKADNQYALNDFGKKSILNMIEQIYTFLESFNTVKVDETNRKIVRKDLPLFDSKCLREALLNAFIHNDWTDLNAPMITVYVDRIEIASHGTIPPNQTIDGFFGGISKPRCPELAELFLKLRISEKSGRGVKKILETYGKEVFEIGDSYIIVTIPFSEERQFGSMSTNSYKNDVDYSDLPKAMKNKNMIISEIRHNANITIAQLVKLTGLGKTSVKKYLKELSESEVIEHVGTSRNGYWKVIDKW